MSLHRHSLLVLVLCAGATMPLAGAPAAPSFGASGASAAPVPQVESAFERAWALYEKGEPSFEAFQKVLDDDAQPAKDRFNAAYVLGVQSLARRDAEGALGLLARAERLLPGRPQVRLRRTDALLQLGRLEEARAVLAEVALGAQSRPQLRLRHALTTAMLLHAEGRSDLAIEDLRRLGEAHPKEWEPFYLMGLVYESFDLPEDAMRAYARAIENDPGRDPFPGIYAYQRWAAMAISLDPNSYQDKAKKEAVIARYREFLRRAGINGVPEKLVEQVRVAIDVLRRFGA